MDNRGQGTVNIILEAVVVAAVVLLGVLIYGGPEIMPPGSELPTKAALTPKTSGSQKEKMPADTAGLNGKIYTVNPKQPWAEGQLIFFC